MTKTLAVPVERELLAGLVEIADQKMLRFYGKIRPGSPNHSHEVPGVWDSDNGDLAGRPCAECALYDRARALLSAPVVDEPEEDIKYTHLCQEDPSQHRWMKSMFSERVYCTKCVDEKLP